MAKIKNACVAGYMISCNADGAISVAKDYENQRQALRDIAKSIGYEYNPDWGTQQLGKKVIEQILSKHVATKEEASAVSGEYIVFKDASGPIHVFKDYDNVKGALREISEKIGFDYDTDWTTRQFGSKLITYLSKENSSSDENGNIENEQNVTADSESFTLIEKINSAFIIEDDDEVYFDAERDDENVKAELLEHLKNQCVEEEWNAINSKKFADSADFVAYLEDDPDEVSLAYKLIAAAYMTRFGYDDDSEFYVDETLYYFNDAMDLHYEYETDIDFG